MIQPIQYGQIPECVALLKRAYARSIYAQSATVDEAALKTELVNAIKRHGHKNQNGTLMLGSMQGNALHGVLWGVQCPIYLGLRELMVTDELFILEPKADPYDAMRMLRMLMAWARKLPKVIEVCLAANDSLHPNWEALKPLYTRLGLKPCGAMYRTEIQ